MTDPDKAQAQDRRLAGSAITGGRLRSLLLELWQRTRFDWGFVSDRLSQTFRKETWLGAHDRRFVAETLYGMVRQLRRIDAAVSRGGRRGAPRDTDRLLAYLLLDGLITAADAARAEPALDWGAVATIDEHIARERDPAKRVALACSLPDWLAAHLVADWGDRAEAVARSLGQRAPMTVRANRLKTTREALAQAFAAHGLTTTPGRFADDALVVDTRTNLFALPELKAGLFEMQDEGSQLLAALVAPGPSTSLRTIGGVVVDLCAGAGGKTLALAAMMDNKGQIYATDDDKRRLAPIHERLTRSGARNVQVRTPKSVGGEIDDLAGRCDLVLIDAPCTGTGSWRRNPDAKWRMRPGALEQRQKEQAEILERAVPLLKAGGRIVYVTCSVLDEENGAQVRAFLVRHPEFSLQAPADVTKVLGERAFMFGNAARLSAEGILMTPRTTETDGFFVAVLKRG